MDVAEFGTLAGCPVFVTGARGFIGRRVAEALVAAGADVRALARSPAAAKVLASRGMTPVIGGLDTGLDLSGIRIVFNFAHDFRAPAAESLTAFDALVAVAAEAGVDRIIHTSSAVVYDAWPCGEIVEGGPETSMGTAYRQAKIGMTERLEASGLRAAILEPTIVYGPGGWLWTDGPCERLLSGTVVLPDPVGICHAVHVDDVAQAALKAAVLPDLGCERFIISSGEAVTWADFYQGYRAILGQGQIEMRPKEELAARLPADTSPTTVASAPPLAARLGAVARRWLGKRAVDRLRVLVARLKRLKGGTTHYPDRYALMLYSAPGRCPADHARARLGFDPVHSLASGQADTAAYIRDRFV